MKNTRRWSERKANFFSFLSIAAVLFIFPAGTVHAQDYIPLVTPSAILVEQSTGRILYTKNEAARMYPASMTKVLTALVVLDYLNPDDIVVVGGEIRSIPPDYNTAVHTEGESITIRNLLRALIIRSGNETGCILAINTIRAKENRSNITYDEAERSFSALMNEKARELGALNSNFNNPYGYHNENHYTTAYDMALISRAYMENETLRMIAAERVYIGDSLEGRVIEGAQVRAYTWESHNELLLGGPNAYPYAIGIKTGFTDEAGDCLTASAKKGDIELIAVIFNSEDPGRWQDARLLFDYGFGTYAFSTLQEKDVELGTITLANPRLGDSETMTVLADGYAQWFLSAEEEKRIVRNLQYDPALLEQTEPPSQEPLLRAPVEKDAVLGTVTYTLDGQVLYEGTFRAADSALERTFDSDTDYYIAQFKENVFSIRSLPYWIGGVGLLIGIIGLAAAIGSRRQNRRNRRGISSYGRYGGYR